MCPVCTVTVVAGLGLSRLLGIDDVIISVWIGGFILSFSFITYDWIAKRWKWFRHDYYLILTIVLMYLLVLVPLKLDGSIGMPLNRLWGIDKIILGTTAGSLMFLLGAWADKKVRKIKGKQLFKFQKVIFPVLALILTSAVGFILTA